MTSTTRSSRSLRRTFRLGLACGAALLSAACGGGQTGDEVADDQVTREIRGNAQRLAATGPENGPASADNEAFAWRLFGLEASPGKNAIMSPYSVSVAAAMLSAGARGETLAEIQQALGFSSEGDGFHAGQNRLLQSLDSRNREGTEEQNAQALRLTNDLWMLPELQPASEFLDVLSAYYGAGVQLTRFDTDPEPSRQAINQKVADDTEGLIDELLPERSITSDVLMVLTNAIYFKSRWSSPFDSDATETLPFETDSGAMLDAEMMRNQGIYAPFVVNAEYSAVALRYDGGDLELVAIMPASGSYQAFVEGLTPARVAGIRGELSQGYLDLRFPKFEIEASLPLKQHLVDLGMVQAFDQSADFGLIADNMYISDAFHDAVIILDEEGTEAAAATAFVGRVVSEPPPPEPLSFDRAFVFFIRDVDTGATLFVGQLVTPG